MRLLPILLLAGLAALMFRGARGPRPTGVLTVWREKYLPAGWPELAKSGDFGAVSMKVVDGTSAFQPTEAARVLEQARAAGLRAGPGGERLERLATSPLCPPPAPNGRFIVCSRSLASSAGLLLGAG